MIWRTMFFLQWHCAPWLNPVVISVLVTGCSFRNAVLGRLCLTYARERTSCNLTPIHKVAFDPSRHNLALKTKVTGSRKTAFNAINRPIDVKMLTTYWKLQRWFFKQRFKQRHNINVDSRQTRNKIWIQPWSMTLNH